MKKKITRKNIFKKKFSYNLQSAFFVQVKYRTLHLQNIPEVNLFLLTDKSILPLHAAQLRLDTSW